MSQKLQKVLNRYITGSGTTNPSGAVSDVYIIKIIGAAPSNTNILATQTINAAGYSGNNNITVTISSISDTSPVSLN